MFSYITCFYYLSLCPLSKDFVCRLSFIVLIALAMKLQIVLWSVLNSAAQPLFILCFQEGN